MTDPMIDPIKAHASAPALTRLAGLGLALALLALAAPAGAQFQRQQKASFVLNSDRTAYDAGAPARVAALVSIERGWHVNSAKPTFEYLIPTVLELALPAGWSPGPVTYPPAEMQKFAFETQPLAVYDGDVVIFTEVKVPAGTAAGSYPMTASLRYQACNDSQCLPPVTAEAEIQPSVGADGKPQHGDLFTKAARSATGGGSETAPPAPATAKPAGGNLAVTLLLALLGGLILNAMPCVLPVLSL